MCVRGFSHKYYNMLRTCVSCGLVGSVLAVVLIPLLLAGILIYLTCFFLVWPI